MGLNDVLSKNLGAHIGVAGKKIGAMNQKRSVATSDKIP